jgi:hypothetical protein
MSRQCSSWCIPSQSPHLLIVEVEGGSDGRDGSAVWWVFFRTRQAGPSRGWLPASAARQAAACRVQRRDARGTRAGPSEVTCPRLTNSPEPARDPLARPSDGLARGDTASPRSVCLVRRRSDGALEWSPIDDCNHRLGRERRGNPGCGCVGVSGEPARTRLPGRWSVWLPCAWPDLARGPGSGVS